MAKPKKERRVQHPPAAVYFKPQGVPMIHLEQVILRFFRRDDDFI